MLWRSKKAALKKEKKATLGLWEKNVEARDITTGKKNWKSINHIQKKKNKEKATGRIRRKERGAPIKHQGKREGRSVL